MVRSGLKLGTAAMALLVNNALADPAANGEWIRDDGNARVRIAPCGGNLCATNTWIKDTSNGEAVGDQLVMTVQPKSAGMLAGKAYDPKRGLTYSITIKAGTGTLSTRGCIVGVVCKTVNWARAN